MFVWGSRGFAAGLSMTFVFFSGACFLSASPEQDVENVNNKMNRMDFMFAPRPESRGFEFIANNHLSQSQ